MSAWRMNWGLFAGSCGALLAGYFSTGWLWGRIVADLGGPRLPLSVSVRLFMIANLGRYVPGKVWQIAGLAVLGRSRGVPPATAAAAAVLGQGIALAAALLVGLTAVWPIMGDSPWRWAVPAGVIAASGLALTPPAFRAITGAWFRIAKTDVPAGLTPLTALSWLMVGLGSWVIYASAFWLLVKSLGVSASFLPTASAFAAAYVLGYVALFAPAGIGVREGFLIMLLSPQLGATTAGAIAIFSRLWTTVLEVGPAAAFWAHHVATAREIPGE
jgi:hypothetical protein